ncbi:MAG: hypothetical protein WCG29_02075, partial [Desulfomonile sp.]
QIKNRKSDNLPEPICTKMNHGPGKQCRHTWYMPDTGDLIVRAGNNIDVSLLRRRPKYFEDVFWLTTSGSNLNLYWNFPLKSLVP